MILLVEMPPWIINFSISLNITLGIVLLMISLYVQKPLELAAFPSIILLGTMFRLVLSIASTRLILAKGEAGEVIHAFGTFVTGGNMIVGGVIFLIITVVQFMVITKVWPCVPRYRFYPSSVTEKMIEQVYGLEDHGVEVKHYGIYAADEVVADDGADEIVDEAAEAKAVVEAKADEFDDLI
jgi:hypothetical protein